jgi:hypothetical protein
VQYTQNEFKVALSLLFKNDISILALEVSINEIGLEMLIKLITYSCLEIKMQG